MDTRSITCLNLETGETLETNVKLSNNKFKQRGHTMYNYGTFVKNSALFLYGS